jgi:inosine-uridine nucleoside N-ribohydrolase
MQEDMIWIDSDGGVDDCLALAFALKYFNDRDIILSSVFGNVSNLQAAANIQEVLRLSGVNIPVLIGKEEASDGFKADATHVHGTDGLGGTRRHSADTHHDQLYEYFSSIKFQNIAPQIHQKGINILSIGPSTNVPFIVNSIGIKHIRSVTLMTGVFFDRGNISQTAEFNAYCDPFSIIKCIELFPKTTIVPLDFCRKFVLYRTEKSVFNQFPKLRLLLQESHNFYMEKYENAEGICGCYPHDFLALAAVLNPKLFLRWNLAFDITCTGDNRGTFFVHEYGRYHAQVVLGGNLRGIRDFLHGRKHFVQNKK